MGTQWGVISSMPCYAECWCLTHLAVPSLRGLGWGWVALLVYNHCRIMVNSKLAFISASSDYYECIIKLR